MFSFCIFLCMFSRSSRHVSLTAHRSDLCYVVRAVAVNHKAGQIKDRNGCGEGVNSNCHTFIMSPSCPASKPFQGTSVPAIKALALLARCQDSPRRQPWPGLSNAARAPGLLWAAAQAPCLLLPVFHWLGCVYRVSLVRPPQNTCFPASLHRLTCNLSLKAQIKCLLFHCNTDSPRQIFPSFKFLTLFYTVSMFSDILVMERGYVFFHLYFLELC